MSFDKPELAHGPRAWPRARGRGGRLGRLFAHGDLHLLVLHLIHRQPRHGYEIIKQIEAMVGGEYTPSPGTIYPALTLLDEQDYVAASLDERGKKIYAVTGAGLAYLERHADAVHAMIETMSHLSRGREDGPSLRIRAAAGALKAALHARMDEGALPPETQERVVLILDQATRDILNA